MQLWAQEVFRQPVWWWVGLCSHRVACLGCGIQALGVVGLLGGAGSWCQSSSLQRAHSSEYSPIPTPPVWATATPAFPWGPFQDQHVGLAQAYEVTAFPRDPSAHKTVCIFQNGVSVYPSPVEDCNQAPLVFKAKAAPPIARRPPNWDAWDRAQNSPSYRRNSPVLIIFQSAGMRFDCIADVPFLPILLWLLLCLWM